MNWLDRFRRNLARRRVYEDKPPLCDVRYLGVHLNVLRQKIAAAPRQLPQYQATAEVWPQFSGDFVPNYLPYIAFLARRYRLDCDVALDLACGSGQITEQLLRRFGHVHCLDRSPAMLRRLRGDFSMIRGRFTVHEADFREFALPVTMPFAVCAGNSLNYVETVEQLAATFRCVAASLREGGFFLFDVIALPYDGLPPDCAFVIELTGHVNGPYWFCTWYDGPTEYSYVLCPEGVEEHRRRLLPMEDIAVAAKAGGLVVEDHFLRQRALYCVLRKP